MKLQNGYLLRIILFLSYDKLLELDPKWGLFWKDKADLLKK